jgi:hypothetical protein
MGRICIVLLSCALLATFGCRRAEAPKIEEPKRDERPTFQPPSAREAFELEGECVKLGDVILRENIIGSALTEEVVSQYNPRTNRCYVLLNVHSKDLSKFDQFDDSFYLKDGQTKDLLAFYTHRGNDPQKYPYLGFGCNDEPCVEQRIDDCMKGKNCEP